MTSSICDAFLMGLCEVDSQDCQGHQIHCYHRCQTEEKLWA
jgi:hypothetical protein